MANSNIAEALLNGDIATVIDLCPAPPSTKPQKTTEKRNVEFYGFSSSEGKTSKTTHEQVVVKEPDSWDDFTKHHTCPFVFYT
jgi:hypothetical protein